MLRCAVDVRNYSIRLALYGFWNSKNEPPALLEKRLIPSRSAARVLETLETWRYWYGLNGDRAPALVGCTSDAWPAGLARRLETAGYTVQWIEASEDLADGLSFLESLQQGRLFMRATLMAHWPSAVRRHCEGAGLEAQYAFLRGRLMDLEYDLCVEGSLPCPGHLAPTCLNCEFLRTIPSDGAQLQLQEVPTEQRL